MGFQPTICKSAVTLQDSCPKLEPQDSVDEKYEHAQQEYAEEGRYRREHGLHNHSHACVTDKSELHLFPSSGLTRDRSQRSQRSQDTECTERRDTIYRWNQCDISVTNGCRESR